MMLFWIPAVLMTLVEMVWSCLIAVILLLYVFCRFGENCRFIIHCKHLAWLVWASFGHDWGKIEYFLHVEKVAFQVPHRIYGGSLLPLHTAVPHDTHQWNLRDENAFDLVFTPKWPKKVFTRSLSYSDHVCYVHRLPCRSEMFQVISTMPRHHSSFCKATVQLPLEKVCPRRSATMANVGQPVWNCTSAWSSREATTRFLMVSLSKSSACQSNHLPSYHLCLVALRARSSLAYDSSRLEDDNGRLIIVNTDGRERLSVHTHYDILCHDSIMQWMDLFRPLSKGKDVFFAKEVETSI